MNNLVQVATGGYEIIRLAICGLFGLAIGTGMGYYIIKFRNRKLKNK